MTHIINISDIRIYAYHGCLKEETKVGGNYIVDVEIETDFTAAFESDRLDATVDYCTVASIVQREMKIPSKLIEHVGGRITDSLKSELKNLKRIKVTIRKLQPPVAGEVGEVSITIAG